MPKHRNPRASVSSRPTPDNRRAALPEPEPTFNIGAALGILQEIIGRTDAMVYAVERHFERFGWHCRDEVDETDNPRRSPRAAHRAARDASLSAVSASSVIAAELAKQGGVA
jgi:hypothetical protein